MLAISLQPFCELNCQTWYMESTLTLFSLPILSKPSTSLHSLGQSLIISHMNCKQQPALGALWKLDSLCPPTPVHLLIPWYDKMAFLEQITFLFSYSMAPHCLRKKSKHLTQHTCNARQNLVFYCQWSVIFDISCLAVPKAFISPNVLFSCAEGFTWGNGGAKVLNVFLSCTLSIPLAKSGPPSNSSSDISSARKPLRLLRPQDGLQSSTKATTEVQLPICQYPQGSQLCTRPHQATQYPISNKQPLNE